YDAEHRMVEVTTARGTYRYVYDALGRRTEKQHISPDGKPYNRTTFLWDGMRLAQESRPEGTDSLYIYRDPGSYEPLARVDKAGKEGPNRILYFHTDVNGAPEEMTDSDGKIVWETGYQVWGNTIQEKDHGRVEQNLRYQGQYLDRETGLHYNLHRYYDPDVGRFMVTDPIGLRGGLNLYAYAPNPLGWIDPLGLSCLKPENGYLRGKAHGIKWTQNDALKRAEDQARKTGRAPLPQGKWGSKRDLKYAGEKAATLQPGEMKDFPINSDHSSVVFNPDGTIDIPDKIRVRNNGDGTFHGFPINSKTAEPIYTD
ncbi:RHS domain-containing protein, partial [Escherichia coli]|nr:RHS domain-containing protein [Escherichia coli]